MTSNRFYIELNEPISNRVILQGEEHHHLSRVSRVGVNDRVQLFDGKGTSYVARVEKIGKKETELVILEKTKEAREKTRITLAQALVKSKAMEIIIQKAVELGAYDLVPVTTARSVVDVREKAAQKLSRWKKIAQEAVRQSGRSRIPDIFSPLTLKNLVATLNADRKFLLSENRGILMKEILLEYSSSNHENIPESVIILSGPEGGWEQSEENYILENGFEAVSLGKNTLRSETASLCSLALISHFWNG